MNLGNALQYQGKLEQSIAESREALRLRPDYPEAHNNLGAALEGQGRPEEAIAEFRQALRLKPDYPEAHLNVSIALARQGKLEEAIAEHRQALRLRPDYPEAHNNLGNALADRGRLEEAFGEFREALRLNSNLAEAHGSLGDALRKQGKLGEAVAEFREALRLKPDYPELHANFGGALRAQGKLAEAVAEYRRAIQLKPDLAEAYCNLADLLRAKGAYREALAELRRGHELGSKRPDWRYPSDQWVRQAERMVELENRLPDVLKGKDRPASAAEGAEFAYMAHGKGHYAGAARLFADAFRAEPKLIGDMQAQNRYNAACAAARAGAGQGKGEPPLDEAGKARWRKQAIDWLKADLAFWARQVETGPPQARASVAQTLQHWKDDPDLAGIRDDTALGKLPVDEQKACRALWAEVYALLAKAHGGTKP
jgi:Flp pilus assembly protein TadD